MRIAWHKGKEVDERHKKVLRVCSFVLFGIYLILLIYFLFFAESTGRTYEGRGYHYNLVPFLEIRRFLAHWEHLGIFAVVLNLLGNVVAFVPFGIFLPAMSPRFRSFWRIALCTFGFSLLVELLQLVCKVGSFDVDDLFLNTVGGALGYMAFVLLNRVRRHRHEEVS